MFNESAKISGNVSISNQVWTTKGHKGYTKDTKNELKSASLDREAAIGKADRNSILTFVSFVPEASGFFVSEVSDLCGPRTIKLRHSRFPRLCSVNRLG